MTCLECGGKGYIEYETGVEHEGYKEISKEPCTCCLKEIDNMKMKAWKIRNKETGEFSKGGSSHYNIWTNRGGKTWSTIGALKNHLNLFQWKGEISKDYPYHNAEIVEVEIDYSECFAYPVNTLIEDMVVAKKDKAKQSEIMHQKWVEAKERKQLEELRKKYEGR